MTEEKLRNSYTYHTPFGNQTVRYNAIRETAHLLAIVIDKACQDSREKALAMANLEQAVMWANKSIAVNEKSEAAGD